MKNAHNVELEAQIHALEEKEEQDMNQLAKLDNELHAHQKALELEHRYDCLSLQSYLHLRLGIV